MPPATVRIAPDHPAFAGHFPGSPVWPGVCLLAEVIEQALRDPDCAPAIGSMPRLAVAKFQTPVRPGDTLQIILTVANGRVAFECRQGTQLAASGHFEPTSRLFSP